LAEHVIQWKRWHTCYGRGINAGKRGIEA